MNESATELRRSLTSRLYPSLMVKQGYTSRNIPDDKLFEQIYWDRLKAKNEGDKVISDTYKLILNTTYGCMLNPYNDLYDPLMGRSVCVSGQLFLTDLVVGYLKQCETIRIINLNTDGVLFSIDDSELPKVHAVNAERSDSMRSIPWSEEAEQALLGSMLLDKEAADTALDIVTVNDFYMDKHREVFAAIAKLRGESQPVDAITITQTLRDKGSIDSVGGAYYISTLVNTVPTAANVKYYADIVKEKSMLRRVIAVGQNAIQMAYDQDPEAVELLQAGAFDLDSRISAAEPVSYTETCSEVMDILTERYISKSIVTGVPTGFVDLDERTAGLQPSELIVLGGRPSMGKSVMAQCIAENAARAGHSVLLAILEDTRTNLLQRSIARLAKVDLLRLRKGQIRDEEWARVSHALGELQNLPAWFLGPVNVKVPTIRAAARKLKREQQLDLIIVDYLQLLADGDDSTKAVGETSRQLKALAQELEVPVLAVAQLSRSCETRSDKRPTLADLRDSGQIEQDADVVMFVYRDEYYYGNTSKQGIAEIIIAKQRNGPVGTVELQFDERFVVFRDLAKWVPA